MDCPRSFDNRRSKPCSHHNRLNPDCSVSKTRKSLKSLQLESMVILATSSENLSSGLPTRSDINRAVQPQKMARGLKFRIYDIDNIHSVIS